MNLANIPSLCLVCRLSHAWMTPILYNSVVLSSTGWITRFFITLKSAESRVAHLVHAIWIGPSTMDESLSGTLTYGYGHANMIEGILKSCTSLRTFVLINFNHDQWPKIESAIPNTLENLVVGPIHGSLDMRTLARAPGLRTLTSLNTYLRDDEVRDVVLCPNLRHFRRVVSSHSWPFGFAMDQLPIVSKSETLEKMEILIIGPDEKIDGHKQHMLEHPASSTDGRITFTFESDRGLQSIGWLFDEFLSKGRSACFMISFKEPAHEFYL